MGEIINLRTRRKRQERSKAEAAAAQNRIDFGLTKLEKSKAAAERETAARQLSGHALAGKPDSGA